jgi:hypothetical protein
MRIGAIAVVVAAVSCGGGDGEKISTNSYLGARPPEFKVESWHWINASSPVSLSALRGRVVWLEFSFLG